MLLKRLTALLLTLCLLFTAFTVLGEDVVITIIGDEEDTESEYDEDTAASAAQDLTEEEQAAMDAIAALLGEEEEGVEVDVSELELAEDLPSNVVNILLLGIDNRSVELETGRSDAIMICSINTDTGAVKLTSFARDTAVTIPGYKNTCPINNAFKYGSKKGDMDAGARLAMRTINRNFHMNLQYYVVVNIYGLASIIEALGGVDIELTKAEAKEINNQLFKVEPMRENGWDYGRLEQVDGVQHLDGMQATTYGRIRHLTGQNDINRNQRQRKMIEAVVAKVMEGMDLMKFLDVVATALPYGITNLTLSDLTTLGLAVLKGEAMDNLTSGGEVFSQFGIPMEGQYGYRTFTVSGSEKSLVYISENRLNTTLTAWFEFLYEGAYTYQAD